MSKSMTEFNKKNGAIVVVISYDAQIRRMLWRILTPAFGDRVFGAADVEEAERILSKRKVTHLVCDHAVSTDAYNCYELIALWRKHWASIRKAIVLRGNYDPDVLLPPEVDFVFSKQEPPEKIIRALGW